MWDLERTERLVARLLPLIILVTVLALVWMTLCYPAGQLSSAFTQGAPSSSATD